MLVQSIQWLVPMYIMHELTVNTHPKESQACQSRSYPEKILQFQLILQKGHSFFLGQPSRIPSRWSLCGSVSRQRLVLELAV